MFANSPSTPGNPSTTEKGRQAEELALAHLHRRGLRLLARNYRCRVGEVDLIMEHAGRLVFVEVRSLASSSFVSPKETVGWRKQQRIIGVANSFLRVHPALAHQPVRFDVVSVTQPNYNTQVEWIQGAFQADDPR